MARRAAAALAFAGTAVLAGCGGSSSAADPSSPTPLTSSGPPTVSSGSASPSLDPNSDAAILAAVQNYAAAFTAVGQTASTGALAGAVDPSCPCVTTFNSAAAELSAKKEHLDAVIEAANPRILRRNGTNADVAVDLTNQPYHVLNAEGGTVAAAAAATSIVTLSLERKGDEWLVFYVRSGSS